MCDLYAFALSSSSPGILHGSGEVLLSRFRRDPRQMEEDEEAWFDEEEEITATHSDPFPSSSTLSLNSIPILTLSGSTTSSSVTVSTTSSPFHPPIPRCPSYANLLAPSTSPSPAPSPAPSPFTQVSYSPRPASALTRSPLLESAIKAPIVTQVCTWRY